MSNTTETITASEKSRVILDEDWAVVVLGFIIIFLFVGGLIIPAPVYKWNNAQDLSQSIFSSGNLLRILYQFILVFVFSILASIITNKPFRSALKVFPVLYVISVIALLLEGNGAI